MGRGVLVVPMIRGLDPFGFIGKYQGYQARGKTVSQVAEGVFQILASSPKTRSRMLTCLVDAAVHSADPASAIERLTILESLPDLPLPYVERLRDGAASAVAFSPGPARDHLNGLLTKRALRGIGEDLSDTFAVDDAIPF